MYLDTTDEAVHRKCIGVARSIDYVLMGHAASNRDTVCELLRCVGVMIEW